MLSALVGLACLGWSIAVILFCTIGIVQIWLYYREPPARAVSETALDEDDVPHVTIIRPVKGLEPCLYDCLASTFYQTYPNNRITVYFCVATRSDAAFPLLQSLVRDFGSFDVKILVQDEDEASAQLGPNPKIKNMSRAYREAKSDIVWIIDCNVWVAKGVLGRMVDKLCGFKREGSKLPFKFVHQLPLVVDVTDSPSPSTPTEYSRTLDERQVASTSTASTDTISTSQTASDQSFRRWLELGGSQLEESFLASSHAKFYTAINTILLAPCIVGKSNMFRRSHLDELTMRQSVELGLPKPASGLDYFSENICEDHLIGDLLWKKPLRAEMVGNESGKQRWGKHGLLYGDLAIQPMANMSVREYCARRARWLRVRKFTVTTATLVEPGTESLLCSAYASWAITTLPCFQVGGILGVGIPPTWTSFAVCWILMALTWLGIDWTLYGILHRLASIDADETTPAFAHPRRAGHERRSFTSWLPSWLAREGLALPIWLWAVYGGTSVRWRGQRFRVGLDMRVHELSDVSSSHATSRHDRPHANGVVQGTKARAE
ncbi:MAG: hypothetical protein M1828_002064 [Chrysothrix sp. TS-e1954]|nr:MAG: hypothetical protein M1828_002064 [Chrysothrix sp. TS-e1954]